MDRIVVEYTGSPMFVGFFAQMAEEEGLEATYEPPVEHRDAGATAAVTVAVYLGMKAVDKATDRALDEAVDRLIAKWKAGRGARVAEVKKAGPRHRS